MRPRCTSRSQRAEARESEGTNLSCHAKGRPRAQRRTTERETERIKVRMEERPARGGIQPEQRGGERMDACRDGGNAAWLSIRFLTVRVMKDSQHPCTTLSHRSLCQCHV